MKFSVDILYKSYKTVSRTSKLTMAYNTINSTRLELLSKDNYDTWRIQAEALLIKNDTWGYVSGEKSKPVVSTDPATSAQSQAAYDAWFIEDRKAKSDLILSIHPSELKQVKGCETSKSVWDKLESIYASKGPARKATLLKNLMLRKMPEDGNVKDHLNDLFDAVDKLQSMDVEINGDMLAIIILYSLPDSYDTFRCAIESRDDLPDAETLKIKIIEESEARKRKPPDQAPNALLAKQQNHRSRTSKGTAEKENKGTSSSTNKRVKCNYCKRFGHKAVDCYAKKNSDQKAGHAAETALLANNKNKLKGWCLDSGCTSHLCSDKELFVNTTNTSSGLKLANNDVAKVQAVGDVRITASVNKDNNKIRLKDALYVPDLRTNLLSVAKIVDNGHKVLFTKDRATVQDSRGNTTMIAKRVNNLFYLQESFNSAYSATDAKRSQLRTWHERLGHLNVRDVSRMHDTRTVFGMKLDRDPTPFDCKTCAAGKLTQTAFPTRSSGTSRTSGALDLVHTDVCGPMRTESESGARYFVTFIDDYTRWCEVYFLRNKSEVTEKFKEFMSVAERQTGRRIKAIQSDNGKEYCNTAMDTLLKERGIRHRLTVPHTPEQNGIAERKNRTLVEAARCMMIQSGLPPSLWAEAIATANYIRNRCVTKSLDTGTPFEKWTGRRPSIAHMRTFGCDAYILDKSPGKGKFDPRGQEGIFVGYSDKSKAYRMWSPKDRKVYISRDVKFFDEFNSKEPFEDIVTSETRNGRSQILECTGKIRETLIGQNKSDDQIEDDTSGDQIENNTMNDEEEPGIADTPKRGPGRPKGAATKVIAPTKLYNLRSRNKQQAGEADTIEISSDDDTEPNESLYAFLASEISLSQAIDGPEATEWKNAICDEMKSLIANDTWELVEKPSDANVVGCRIVLRNKYLADGSLEKKKARVVARGFSQRPGIDFHDTFAPVARLSSLRMLVAISARMNMSISQLDITSAYLHGEINDEVYMEAPQLLEDMLKRIITDTSDEKMQRKAKIMLSHYRRGHRTCRLRKALYGLRQAGRQWHSKLDTVLRGAGLIPTNADPCVYVNHKKTVFLLVYVDDILIATKSRKCKEDIVRILKEHFSVKDLGEAKYCLGIEIIRNGRELCLSQTGYIKSLLTKFGMTDCKGAATPLTLSFKPVATDRCCDRSLPYRELIGSLMYVAVATRPDIAHAVSVLSQFNNQYDQRVWTEAKHVLRYLKETRHLGLRFKPTEDGLSGYVDADWGNCQIDRKSYTGIAFTLSGAAISWESRKQRTVALSSTEAEYMGLTDAAKEAIYLISFLKELGFEKLGNVTIFNDNQGAGELARNPVYHGRSKHIDIRYHFVREALSNHLIKLDYKPTEQMIADVLTKTLNHAKQKFCAQGLGLMNVK